MVAERWPSPEGRCDDPIDVWESGEVTGSICPDDVDAAGFTAVDLSDDWTPFVFSEAEEGGRQPYREIFLALADERLEDIPPHFRERYLELYGIFPTFRLLRGRLADEERHACHAAVDDEIVESMEQTLRAWGNSVEEQTRRVRTVAHLRMRLERVMAQRGLSSIDELRDDARHGRLVAQYARERVPVESVMALQAHLVCDGLLSRHREGVFDYRTANAVNDYHQMHMVLSAGLYTSDTRAALRRDSKEGDFMALLRALRERVISGTGLIEDGSAGRAWGTVLGRELDPAQFRMDAGQPAADNPAPDLVSQATEAAANALGWTSFEAANAFFAALPDDGTASMVVALPLPELPGYHGEHMELRAEVHRGDVWYAYPYTATGGHRSQPVNQRPVLTLYARDGDRDVALIRWATTIGGWKPELDAEGKVGLRYKNSPAGPVIWRDVVASPAWLPPAGTPGDELVKRVGDRLIPRLHLLGPSYRSAYGLAMLMHTKVIPPREEGGEPRFWDEGVRAHGSASYRSILRGTSHGCHRLYNHLAVRLTSFVVSHREHIRHGRLPASYQRTVTMEDGASATVRVTSRGYRFELTPPVPVEVLESNLRGPVRRPMTAFRPLREELIPEVMADAAEDGV